MIGPRGPGIVHRVDHDLGQIGRGEVEIRTRVQAGQQQQILDQMGHPLGLGLHPRHRVRRVFRQRGAIPAGELGVAADGGEWIAELVRGIGHELPDLDLAGLPGGKGAVDIDQHVVDRLTDPADLGGRVGVFGRDPHVQGDIASVELAAGRPVERSRRRG